MQFEYALVHLDLVCAYCCQAAFSPIIYCYLFLFVCSTMQNFAFVSTELQLVALGLLAEPVKIILNCNLVFWGVNYPTHCCVICRFDKYPFYPIHIIYFKKEKNGN